MGCMEYIEHPKQFICLKHSTSMGENSSKYKSESIEQFLQKLFNFLSKKNYGVCIPTRYGYTYNAYLNLEPGYSAELQLNIVKEYLANLTNKCVEKPFEYFMHGLFFYNTKNQIVWTIDYNNPIITNRGIIITCIMSNLLYIESKNISIEDKNLAKRMLWYLISNNKSCYFDSEQAFLTNKNYFKNKNLTLKLQNEDKENFYGNILKLLNLQINY